MAQATRQRTNMSDLWAGPLSKGTREALFVIMIAGALFLALAFLSFDAADPGWSHDAPAGVVHNRAGVVGAWLADVGLNLFGYLAYLFPIMLAYAAWLVLRGPAGAQFSGPRFAVHTLGFILTVASGCALATLHVEASTHLPLDAGGIIGNIVGYNFAQFLNPLGSTLVLFAMAITGFSFFTGWSWLTIMDTVGFYTLKLTRASYGVLYRGYILARDYYAGRKLRRVREEHREVERKRPRKTRRIEPKIAAPPPSERVERERQVPLFEPQTAAGLPALSLLDDPPVSHTTVSADALEALSRQVELKLNDFGVDVDVVEVHPGPVVTRFELELAPGLKVSKVSGLAKDLARALSTTSVRIVDIIPGKTTIGLEIPNEHRELVCLSDVLRSKHYDDSASGLSLALGKDIAGIPMVVDLSRMPHLLVAGTTGSGKSVAINAMILSMLYKATANDVRMIMIDPKMLELSVYEGIPHLLAPVVTDMQQASNALRWSVGEMERRYRLMSALGVRNIGGYNKKVADAREAGAPITDPLFVPNLTVDGAADEQAPELQHLPHIVVIIDELADLMMITGKKVEQLIARLAQKARAAGIHLILATQRPSVDVITGLIKANVPCRVAFQVSSKVDSRTILDQMGAEQLLGHGDMLYVGPGMSTPTRVHGAFVDDHEVHKVVAVLKQSGEAQYLEGVLDGSAMLDEAGSAGAGGMGGDSDEETDELYDKAVFIVTDTRRASISGVQRRLKIGYNRAARMIEQMEEAGVVGPLESNGSRAVLAPPPPKD